MTKRKKQRYETVHDENLLAAKLQGAAALLIFLFYTVRGVFMGTPLPTASNNPGCPALGSCCSCLY